MIIFVAQILNIFCLLRLMKLPLSSYEEGRHKYIGLYFVWCPEIENSSSQPAHHSRFFPFPDRLKTETNPACLAFRFISLRQWTVFRILITNISTLRSSLEVYINIKLHIDVKHQNIIKSEETKQICYNFGGDC